MKGSVGTVELRPLIRIQRTSEQTVHPEGKAKARRRAAGELHPAQAADGL